MGAHEPKRSDGRCIHDKSWDDESAPTHLTDTSHDISISPSTLWPLIQVFIQFAREVQGGSVKRLVFRNPEEYAPTLKSFQSAPQQTDKHHKHPIVVHIAHDQLFIVAVTERIPLHARTIDLAIDDAESAPVLTITEFCESCLDFLNKEQTSFVATLAKEDIQQAGSAEGQSHSTKEGPILPPGPSAFRIAHGSSSSSRSQTMSSHSELTGSFDDTVELAPTVTRDPVVSVDQSRLAEYISKIQTLLRM